MRLENDNRDMERRVGAIGTGGVEGFRDNFPEKIKSYADQIIAGKPPSFVLYGLPIGFITAVNEELNERDYNPDGTKKQAQPQDSSPIPDTLQLPDLDPLNVDTQVISPVAPTTKTISEQITLFEKRITGHHTQLAQNPTLSEEKIRLKKQAIATLERKISFLKKQALQEGDQTNNNTEEPETFLEPLSLEDTQEDMSSVAPTTKTISEQIALLEKRITGHHTQLEKNLKLSKEKVILKKEAIAILEQRISDLKTKQWQEGEYKNSLDKYWQGLTMSAGKFKTWFGRPGNAWKFSRRIIFSSGVALVSGGGIGGLAYGVGRTLISHAGGESLRRFYQKRKTDYRQVLADERAEKWKKINSVYGPSSNREKALQYNLDLWKDIAAIVDSTERKQAEQDALRKGIPKGFNYDHTAESARLVKKQNFWSKTSDITGRVLAGYSFAGIESLFGGDTPETPTLAKSTDEPIPTESFAKERHFSDLGENRTQVLDSSHGEVSHDTVEHIPVPKIPISYESALSETQLRTLPGGSNLVPTMEHSTVFKGGVPSYMKELFAKEFQVPFDQKAVDALGLRILDSNEQLGGYIFADPSGTKITWEKLHNHLDYHTFFEHYNAEQSIDTLVDKGVTAPNGNTVPDLPVGQWGTPLDEFTSETVTLPQDKVLGNVPDLPAGQWGTPLESGTLDTGASMNDGINLSLESPLPTDGTSVPPIEDLGTGDVPTGDTSPESISGDTDAPFIPREDGLLINTETMEVVSPDPITPPADMNNSGNGPLFDQISNPVSETISTTQDASIPEPLLNTDTAPEYIPDETMTIESGVETDIIPSTENVPYAPETYFGSQTEVLFNENATTLLSSPDGFKEFVLPSISKDSNNVFGPVSLVRLNDGTYAMGYTMSGSELFDAGRGAAVQGSEKLLSAMGIQTESTIAMKPSGTETTVYSAVSIAEFTFIASQYQKSLGL